MPDSKGRRILWGWVREARGEAAYRAAGWAGVMALPRVLSLRQDGTLGTEPAGELKVLRQNHQEMAGVSKVARESEPQRTVGAEAVSWLDIVHLSENVDRER